MKLSVTNNLSEESAPSNAFLHLNSADSGLCDLDANGDFVFATSESNDLPEGENHTVKLLSEADGIPGGNNGATTSTSRIASLSSDTPPANGTADNVGLQAATSDGNSTTTLAWAFAGNGGLPSSDGGLEQSFGAAMPDAFFAAPAALDASTSGSVGASPAPALSTATSAFTINLVWDSSALAAPQSFRTGVQDAANLLEAAFDSPITVNIEVGYGEWANQTFGLTTDALGGPLLGSDESYSTLRSQLSSHATTSNAIAAVASLPMTTSLQGRSKFYVPSAEEKALGAISATGTATDGAVGIGTSITGNDLITVALHEITHAMGRIVGGDALDLFRYSSVGQHQFSAATPSPAAYFSIDGGTTDLADFAQTSDPSDFLNGGVQDSALNGSTDTFDEFYSSTSLTTLTTDDLTVMNVLGFQIVTVPTVTETLVSNTGGSSTNPVTSDPAVTGGGDANAVVTISEGTTTLGTTTADGTGKWTFTPTLADGVHTLIASETNAAGTGTASLTFTLDSSVPVTTVVTLTVAGNSGPTAIGIAAPTDANDSASALSAKAGTLPSDGTVLLSDGQTAVTVGQTLTIAQLTGLEFKPTANLFGTSSTFSYTVTDPAANSATGSATLAIMAAPFNPPADFDGDSRSEVLWHNNATGDTGYWTANSGGTITGFHDFGLGAVTYAVAGIGDFAGTGRPQVLWHNASTGDTGYWTIDSSGTVTGFHDFGLGATTYAIAGVGEFDTSAQPEVLWHNGATGDTGYWTTDSSGKVTGFHDFGLGATTYAVAGVGEFDSSGKSEVLWHNSATGDTGYWTTDSSGTVTGFHDFGDGDTAYTIAGVGDFDSSGKSEVLWHNSTTGDTGYWTTDSNGKVTGFHDFGFGDLAYSVAAVGDYDGSRKSEVLWHNSSTGDTGYWVTNSGGSVTGFHDFGLGSTAYNIVPT